jgi:peptidoglycan/LPS O-acetylase OafA/YrhL
MISKAFNDNKTGLTFFDKRSRLYYKLLQFVVLILDQKPLLSNKTYFSNLDTIRFGAAFMVLLSHIISPSYHYLHLPPSVLRLLETLSYGGTGVSVFFVLSGFLITYLLITEKLSTGKINLLNFYLRRSLRIWPLYFAVIVFAFGLYPLLKSAMGLNQVLSTNVWYHVAFLANFDVLHVRQFFTGNDAMSQNVNWSISIEEQFYIFWPLLFVLFPKKLWSVVVALVVALTIGFRIRHGQSFDLLYFHTLAVFPDLAIGGLFAVLCTLHTAFANFIKARGDRAIFLLLISALLLLYFAPELSKPGLSLAFHRIAVDCIVACIITIQALSVSLKHLKAANWHFASNWGKYTYGIYLLHPIAMLILDICARLLKLSMVDFWPVFLQGCASITLTFFMSYLSYRYFESFFLSLKKRFSFTS